MLALPYFVPEYRISDEEGILKNAIYQQVADTLVLIAHGWLLLLPAA